jgi:hypothetical protein
MLKKKPLCAGGGPSLLIQMSSLRRRKGSVSHLNERLDHDDDEHDDPQKDGVTKPPKREGTL